MLRGKSSWAIAGLIAVVGLDAVALGQGTSARRGGGAAMPLALVGGTLIDGRGGPPVRDSVVLLREGRIQTVGTVATTPIPASYRRVSTEGMSVLPGLWDLHTHLQYSAHTDLGAWNARYLPQMEAVVMPAIARQLLMAGVTSARDAMAPLDPVLRVRDRIARGEIPGPTMYVAGALLEHAPPAGLDSFRWPVSGPDDARAKVNRLADKGVNLIKMLCVPDMTPQEAAAIVDQAHARGLKVAAHGRTDDEIRKCLAAGVDDFQHLGIQAVLPDDIMTVIRARVRQGTLYWTPTIGNPINNRYLKDDAEMLDGREWELGLPPAIVGDVRQSLRQLPAMLNRPGFVLADEAMYRRKFHQLKDAGVELLVGTDSGNPGHFHPYATWLELDAWVNHMGVPAMEAIQRATSLAARVMGADRDYGTIEAGKYADVIAVPGDPLRHIDVLRAPAVVIKHGRRVR